MAEKCLRCNAILEDDYQLIFDEIGRDLQLDRLLAEHFGITIEEDFSASQALCEVCVNKLIELYDLTQRNQELDVETIAVENEAIQDFKEEEPFEEVEINENEYENTLEFDCEYEDIESLENLNEAQNTEELLGFDSEKNPICLENVQSKDGLESTTHQDYISKVIKSDLEAIEYSQNTVCRLCQEVLKSHTAVIMHVSTNHEGEDKMYPCIICNLDSFDSTKDLALHIVLQHYEVHTITIYCICPECDKRFSNFIEYNKHSCYKGNTGSRLLQNCDTCSKEFTSNKRYRFHLQFHLDKRRPKACFVCDILFSDENDYFEHIMYAHEKGDIWVCKKCDRMCSSKELYDSHMKIHSAIRSFHCEFCSKSYLYKQMLTSHIKRQHTETDCYQCKICRKILASKHVLTRHMQLMHSEETTESLYKCSACGLVGASKENAQEHIEEYTCPNAKLDTQFLQVAFACEFCEHAYDSVDNLKEHRKVHVKKLFTCWICKSDYTEFKKLKTHILTHTAVGSIQKTFPVNRHYVCDFDSCNQTYLTWPSLRAHKNRHASDSKFTCNVCSQPFRTQSLLNHHQRAYCQNEEYPCQFCTRMCSSQMSLAVHIARKHNNNFIACPTCHSTYSTEEALKEHIDNHHVELTCKQCGKSTKNKRNLETHIQMVHAKVKRFFCPTCNKGYYNNGDLKVHMKAAHSELHKYKCQNCDFTSSYEVSFNAHVLLHESKKPFKCEECSREFTRKMCFKLHLLRHSDVKPFCCPVEGCGRSFVTRGILNTHLRDNHLEAEGKVKKASPRPMKRIRQRAAKPVRSSKIVKYVVVDDTSDSAPLEADNQEVDIVFYDADQGIVLECIDEDNDLIEDLNETDVVN